MAPRVLLDDGIGPAERVFAIKRRDCEQRKRDLLNYSKLTRHAVMSRSLVM
jgi:hypothetical protein